MKSGDQNSPSFPGKINNVDLFEGESYKTTKWLDLFIFKPDLCLENVFGVFGVCRFGLVQVEREAGRA